MELTLSHILFNRHSENIFLTLNLSMQIAICSSTCPLHHRLDFFMLLLLLCVRSLSRQSFPLTFYFLLGCLYSVIFSSLNENKNIFFRVSWKQNLLISYFVSIFLFWNRRNNNSQRRHKKTRAASAKVFVQLAKQESFDRKTFSFKQKLILERWASERERLSAEQKTTASSHI